MVAINKASTAILCTAASVAALAVSAQVQAGCQRPRVAGAAAAGTPAAQAALAFEAAARAAGPSSVAGAGHARDSDGDSIVGLWHTTYTLPDGSVFFESFEQWHADGLEWEGANIALGSLCQGIWERRRHEMVHLFHVGWNFPGFFTETQFITVSGDGTSYHGSFDLKNYDPAGNLITSGPLAPVAGTVAATRLTVDSTSADIH